MITYYFKDMDPSNRTDSRALNDRFRGIATDITAINVKIFEIENESTAHINGLGADISAFQSMLLTLETELENISDGTRTYITAYDSVADVMYLILHLEPFLLIRCDVP